MSEVIWAALIGAGATIAAAIIQTYRKHRPADGLVQDRPVPQPVAASASTSGVSTSPPQSAVAGSSSLSPPLKPDGSITAEEAITWLESQGGRRGKTVTPGGSYYQTVSGLRFIRCACAWEDPSYRCHEFIARTSRGTCYYIGLGRKSGLITCGPKGYHFLHGEVPECV